MIISLQKNKIVKKIINKVKSANPKELVTELKNRDNSIIEAAQLQQVKKYGEKVNPSTLRDYYEGGKLPSSSSKNPIDRKYADYIKTKDRIRKQVTGKIRIND